MIFSLSKKYFWLIFLFFNKLNEFLIYLFIGNKILSGSLEKTYISFVRNDVSRKIVEGFEDSNE